MAGGGVSGGSVSPSNSETGRYSNQPQSLVAARIERQQVGVARVFPGVVRDLDDGVEVLPLGEDVGLVDEVGVARLVVDAVGRGGRAVAPGGHADRAAAHAGPLDGIGQREQPGNGLPQAAAVGAGVVVQVGPVVVPGGLGQIHHAQDAEVAVDRGFVPEGAVGQGVLDALLEAAPAARPLAAPGRPAVVDGPLDDLPVVDRVADQPRPPVADERHVGRQGLALVVLDGIQRQLPQEARHGLPLARREQRRRQVEGDGAAGLGPPGILRAGPPGHEVLGLLQQVRAGLRAALAVPAQRIDHGRRHGIAALGILLHLFQKPGPPRLGLELRAELLQLRGIDEQIGMLPLGVQTPGAAQYQQDAEHGGRASRERTGRQMTSVLITLRVMTCLLRSERSTGNVELVYRPVLPGRRPDRAAAVWARSGKSAEHGSPLCSLANASWAAGDWLIFRPSSSSRLVISRGPKNVPVPLRSVRQLYPNHQVVCRPRESPSKATLPPWLKLPSCRGARARAVMS